MRGRERDRERGWGERGKKESGRETDLVEKIYHHSINSDDIPVSLFWSSQWLQALSIKWGGMGLREESTKLLFHRVYIVPSQGGNAPCTTGCCLIMPFISLFPYLESQFVTSGRDTLLHLGGHCVCITSKAPNQVLEPLAPVSYSTWGFLQWLTISSSILHL